MRHHAALALLAAAGVITSACVPLHKSERAAAPIGGGFSRGGDAQESARAAAFAAREESRRAGTPIRVVQILGSETQIVAGTNLRIRLLAQRNGATSETADVIVYRDLLGHPHLSSWRWVGR